MLFNLIDDSDVCEYKGVGGGTTIIIYDINHLCSPLFFKTFKCFFLGW